MNLEARQGALLTDNEYDIALVAIQDNLVIPVGIIWANAFIVSEDAFIFAQQLIQNYKSICPFPKTKSTI